MAAEHTESDEVIELSPVPGTIVRHRGATVEVGTADRGPVTVEVRDGAAWLRATDEGPGLVLTHGASTVQLTDGAVVVEAHEFEALVVVIAGRVAVKGSTALARTVSAGHAVNVTLDGTAGDAETVAAGELAGDRMVVENLARDTLGPRRWGGRGPDVVRRDPASTHRGAVDGPPPAAPRTEASPLESALTGAGVVADAGGSPAPDVGPTPEIDASSSPATTDSAVATPSDADDGPASRRRLLLVLVLVALIVVAVVAAIAVTAGAATVPPR